MAHQTNIAVNGVTVPVWEFDHTAQEIDDAVDRSYAAVRPNLIDNACFVGGGTGWGVFPINQRGKTAYAPGPGFDRWGVNGGTVTLKPSGVSWSGAYVLNQRMNGLNLADGKVRTVSYVDENQHGFSGVITEVYQRIGDYRFTYDKGTHLYMQAPGQPPAMAWVKLEEGEGQTLFQENGDGTVTVLPQNGMDYQTQLAKCQAYQIELNYRRLQIPTIGTAVKGPGNWYAAIPLPVSMRVSPAISLKNGSFFVECSDGSFPVSKLVPISCTATMALFVITFSGATPTSATSGTFYANGSGSGADAPSVILDANL